MIGKKKFGIKNILHKTLGDTKNILLPPLHIKWKLIKLFVKFCFKYLYTKFPHLLEVEQKVEIFVKPDIRFELRNNAKSKVEAGLDII